MIQPSSERRQHPRVLVDIPLSITSDTLETKVRIKDLSLSGVCCRAPIELTEMTQVAIAFDLPKQEASSVRMQGVVVRCEEIVGSEPALNDLAIFFTSYEGDSEAVLATFLQERLTGQPVS